MASILVQQQVHHTQQNGVNGREKVQRSPSMAEDNDPDEENFNSLQYLASFRRHHAQHQKQQQSVVLERKRRKALMYPDLEWGMPPLKEIPQDYRTFLKVWEMITAVACLYVGFMVPFSLGFEKLYLSGGEQCLFSPEANLIPLFAVTRIIDIFVDIVFWIDIFVNFLSARWVLETEPMVHWTLVDDLGEVANLYLRDTFIIDFLGSLPVQYLDCIAGVDAAELKMVRMLRLFKLFRLRRLETLIVMVQKAFPGSAYIVAFVELFSKFFLVAHITACLFFYIAYGYADPEGNEYQQHLFSNGWVSGDGTLNEDGSVPEHGTEPWVSAMYWAVTTMSTIGYGDISPYTSPERIVGMILMIIGCAFFAWITGKITQLMTEKSSCDQRFDDIMEDLNTFMQQRHLPYDLCERINDYYKVKFPNKKVFDEDNIINDIEAPALKKEIIHHLFHDVVEMVPLFRLATAETQREICFKLRSAYRMPGRVITVAGTEPDSMYMIRFGQVEIRSKGPTVRTATPGSIFGELAIMGLTPSTVRVRTAIAASVCELCELSKESFHDLLASQGGFFGLIRRASQMHLLMLRQNFESARAKLKCLESDPDGKHTGEAEHFYDAMTQCKWEAICGVLTEEQEAESIRKTHSHFDEKKVNHLEEITGKKMLLTTTGSAIHKGFDLPIIFPHGMHIKDLASFSITVLNYTESPGVSTPEKAQGSHHAVSLSADFVNATPEPRPDKSLIYLSAVPILVGNLPMEEAVVRRGKVAARKSFSVTLHEVATTKAYGGGNRSPVELDLAVDMFRKVKCKAWGRIMHNVLGRGASKFFVKKMSELLHQIEDHDERFLAAIRERRLEFMASFAANKNKASVAGDAALVPMDDIERKGLAIGNGSYVQDAGRSDAETLKMMQVIMQKLDQQAEELSAIKSALEQPPHTRQLASGAAAPVDYTGPASETAPQGMAKSSANSSIPLAPANTTPGAPLLSPRQQRLQQLKSSSVQGLREIGEG